jgi:hypothetical protein
VVLVWPAPGGRAARGPDAGLQVHCRHVPCLRQRDQAGQRDQRDGRVPLRRCPAAIRGPRVPVLGPAPGHAVKNLREDLHHACGRPVALRQPHTPDQLRVVPAVPVCAAQHVHHQGGRCPAERGGRSALSGARCRAQHAQSHWGPCLPLLHHRDPAPGARLSERGDVRPQRARGLCDRQPAADPLRAHDPAGGVGLRAGPLGRPELRDLRGAHGGHLAGK